MRSFEAIRAGALGRVERTLRSPGERRTVACFLILIAAMGWIALRGLELRGGRIVAGAPAAVSGDEPHFKAESIGPALREPVRAPSRS